MELAEEVAVADQAKEVTVTAPLYVRKEEFCPLYRKKLVGRA